MSDRADTPHDREYERLRRRLAEVVGEEHADEAARAYEEASIQGLCHEGAWEVAVDRVTVHRETVDRVTVNRSS